jgi:MFS family permease
MRDSPIDAWRRRWQERFALSPNDLLRDPMYRRLWSSIFVSNFGAQITVLALPLTAAILLDAAPTQMGVLTAIESAPFVLLSLPTGVWLDRVRKLPIYVLGEIAIALAVCSVPIAWWFDLLNMRWLYAVAFAIGTVNTVSGSAAQIVLTELVPRERLVEAHAKNALASSMSDVLGPGGAGALIKLTGAPLALLADAVILVTSASILRGIRSPAVHRPEAGEFWRAMRTGISFVAGNRLLVTMALIVGIWHFCYNAALAVQILFATRELGLPERAVGLCYVALGVGTVSASMLGHRISQRLGPGPSLMLGIGTCGAGWALLAVAPAATIGVAAFAAMLFLFGAGAVFVFVNFLALRQAVTPPPLLGRMTATMRWLILIPAVPGALLGGWLGERYGLRTALAFSGCTTLLLAVSSWKLTLLRRVRALPRPATVG